jgi:glyceraldehyde-3-phosphate dehydrogenase/erythrose-4-phosphate dehydrogenase
VPICVGINSCGRFGRSFQRVLRGRAASAGVEVVAMTESSSYDASAHTMVANAIHDSLFTADEPTKELNR